LPLLALVHSLSPENVRMPIIPPEEGVSIYPSLIYNRDPVSCTCICFAALYFSLLIFKFLNGWMHSETSIIFLPSRCLATIADTQTHWWDLRSTPLRWAQVPFHDIHTKSHKIWFSHSEVNKGIHKHTDKMEIAGDLKYYFNSSYIFFKIC
jgi:hypothetical protein